jgi:hypothetical protein
VEATSRDYINSFSNLNIKSSSLIEHVMEGDAVKIDFFVKLLEHTFGCYNGSNLDRGDGFLSNSQLEGDMLPTS